MECVARSITGCDGGREKKGFAPLMKIEGKRKRIKIDIHMGGKKRSISLIVGLCHE